MIGTPVFFEEVIESFDGIIFRSNVRKATLREIDEAKHTIPCKHTIVKDIPAFMYDLRVCVTCGIGLGSI